MSKYHLLSRLDRLQVHAFQAFFRSSEGTLEERFVRAVVLTSDERFREVLEQRPELVRVYLATRRRGGKGRMKRDSCK